MLETHSETEIQHLFTVQEAARMLRISPTWLYERTRRDALPCRRLGKYVRFTREDIERIVAASANQA